MNRLFEIQTLSNRNYRRLADPVTIITGIATILPSLFPNMFGSERLTMAHLNKLFPSNGYWHTQLKDLMLVKMKYLKDVEVNLRWVTGQLIAANLNYFCPGVVKDGPGGEACWQRFYEILRQEAATGGQSPIGNVYNAGFNFQTLALVGGGVLLLALLTKNKTRKK